jgi:tetratricopeptide (TPR) repeat protein
LVAELEDYTVQHLGESNAHRTIDRQYRRFFHSTKGPPLQWRGMEMFMPNQVTADDPRLTVVYENFRRNLIDICKITRQTGAGVILTTVATNLRDCPPLASLHRPSLNAEDLAKWESLYQNGIKMEANKLWPEAIVQFESAAQIDDRYADLQFHLGRCYASADEFSKARASFVLARDLDALRFRADSHIDAVICEVASEQEGTGVHLVDVEQSMAKSNLAPHGIMGEDLFYEHVHLKFAGNYLLAQAIFDQVCKALPKAVRSGNTGPVPSQQQCAEALVLTTWDEYQMAEKMAEVTSRPPFTNQLDHTIRQTAAQDRAESLRKLASMPQALQASRKAYETALRKSPDNCDLHFRFANLAMQSGKADTAAEHLLTIIQKQPWSSEIRTNLGVALERCGRTDEAIAQYRKVLEIDPYYAEAHCNIGFDIAGRGQIDDAIAHYQKALELEPNFARAHYNLGSVLVGRGQIDEAIAHYQKALEIEPNYALAYNKLGDVLTRLGKVQEAIHQYEEAIKRLPNNTEAYNNLAWLLATKEHELSGNPEKAITLAKRACELTNDKSASYLDTLAVTYAAAGRFPDAITTAQKAIQLAADSGQTKLADKIKGRLELYRAGHAYVEPAMHK